MVWAQMVHDTTPLAGNLDSLERIRLMQMAQLYAMQGLVAQIEQA